MRQKNINGYNVQVGPVIGDGKKYKLSRKKLGITGVISVALAVILASCTVKKLSETDSKLDVEALNNATRIESPVSDNEMELEESVEKKEFIGKISAFVAQFNTEKALNVRNEQRDGGKYLNVSFDTVAGTAILLNGYTNEQLISIFDNYLVSEFSSREKCTEELNAQFQMLEQNLILYYSRATEPSGIASLIENDSDKALFEKFEELMLNYNRATSQVEKGQAMNAMMTAYKETYDIPVNCNLNVGSPAVSKLIHCVFPTALNLRGRNDATPYGASLKAVNDEYASIYKSKMIVDFNTYYGVMQYCIDKDTSLEKDTYFMMRLQEIDYLNGIGALRHLNSEIPNYYEVAQLAYQSSTKTQSNKTNTQNNAQQNTQNSTNGTKQNEEKLTEEEIEELTEEEQEEAQEQIDLIEEGLDRYNERQESYAEGYEFAYDYIYNEVIYFYTVNGRVSSREENAFKRELRDEVTFYYIDGDKSYNDGISKAFDVAYSAGKRDGLKAYSDGQEYIKNHPLDNEIKYDDDHKELEDGSNNDNNNNNNNNNNDNNNSNNDESIIIGGSDLFDPNAPVYDADGNMISNGSPTSAFNSVRAQKLFRLEQAKIALLNTYVESPSDEKVFRLTFKI